MYSAFAKLMLWNLVLNIVSIMFLMVFSLVVYCKVNINLSRRSISIYILVLIGLAMRISLSAQEFANFEWSRDPWKFYYIWALDLSFALFFLKNFYDMIACWTVQKNFEANSLTSNTELDFNQEESMTLLEKYRNESSIIFGIYFVFSLPIIILRQITLNPKDQDFKNSIVWALIVMIIIGCLIQIFVAVRLTILTVRSKIMITQLFIALIIVWLYCTTNSAQLIQYVYHVISSEVIYQYYQFGVGEGVILTVREFIMYLTIFFVLYHFSEINHKTLKLTESFQFQLALMAERSQSEQEIQEIFIPKHAKLFRVVMERKLGLDYEHFTYGSAQSLETNQMVDGYADAQQSLPSQSSFYNSIRESLAQRPSPANKRTPGQRTSFNLETKASLNLGEVDAQLALDPQAPPRLSLREIGLQKFYEKSFLNNEKPYSF